tara:strand:+ start:293 stop:583 length:291 start_codon:yes stop_codon:yes gene_type:complete
MKPSTFIVSNHIEAIRMFTTFHMYEDPRSDSFLQNALPACAGAKYISDNWEQIHPSLTDKEADDLVDMIDRAADRMEQFKRDLLNRIEKESENEWE